MCTVCPIIYFNTTEAIFLTSICIFGDPEWVIVRFQSYRVYIVIQEDVTLGDMSPQQLQQLTESAATLH